MRALFERVICPCPQGVQLSRNVEWVIRDRKEYILGRATNLRGPGLPSTPRAGDAHSRSRILTTIILLLIPHFFLVSYSIIAYITDMPATTRSTAKKMRSVTVYTKGSPPLAPAQAACGQSSVMASRKRRSVSKAALKTATKRSCKATDVSADMAAREAEETERAGQMVSTPVLDLWSNSCTY